MKRYIVKTLYQSEEIFDSLQQAEARKTIYDKNPLYHSTEVVTITEE